MIGGLNIVPHVLAMESRMVVQRHAIKKRRRNWRVVRVQRPGCWQIGNTLYVHPTLVDWLKTHLARGSGETERERG